MEELIQAIRSGDTARIQAIIDRLSTEGADLNATFDNGSTLAHLAAREGQAAAIPVLKAAGANLDATT